MPDTDVFILKTLLKAQSEFVSGSSLATALGISRVGVWARLEKFRDEHFEVEAVRHRGYRLLQEPPTLNESLVRAYLALLECDADVTFCEEIDSTNSEAERMLASARKTPFAVLALRQTAGRGRLGRRWHSPNEGNMYASFAFRPNLPPIKMQTITLWMGLQVCDFVNTELGLPVKLKWPNDLMADGKKVAGMLTEARIDADRTRDLVFGIGLNVNGRCADWPKEVSAVATPLAELNGGLLLINRLAAQLTKACVQAYQAFIDGSYQNTFMELWTRYDGLFGRDIQTERNGAVLKGVASGIDENGSLRLKLEDGSMISLHSGEISLGSARHPV